MKKPPAPPMELYATWRHRWLSEQDDPAGQQDEGWPLLEVL